MKENLWWYKLTYNQLIEKGKARQENVDFNPKNKIDNSEVYEKHHIIPRCLGGTNDKENLVFLTPREHGIAHLLLSRIYENNNKLSLTVFLMFGQKKITSTRLYSEYREKAIKMNLGENNPMYGKRISDSHKRIISESNKYKRSDETRRKMSISQRGKKAKPETKEKLSRSHLGLKIHTEEHKLNLRNRWLGENNPNFRKDMSGNNNPASKKVIDPKGRIFESITECANFYGVSKSSMGDWVKGKVKSKPGFKLL